MIPLYYPIGGLIVMIFSTILSRFRPDTPSSPAGLSRAYGEVQFKHLTPGAIDLDVIGIYDPDLMRIAMTKFLEKQPGIIDSVRLATYPGPDGCSSPYLLIQDEHTEDPSRWFGLAPLLDE